MEELIKILNATKNPVYFEFQDAGMTMKIYSDIVSTEVYIDGVEFYFENEASFFLSSITNKVIDKKEYEDIIEFVVKTLNKALIYIKVEN